MTIIEENRLYSFIQYRFYLTVNCLEKLYFLNYVRKVLKMFINFFFLSNRDINNM